MWLSSALPNWLAAVVRHSWYTACHRLQLCKLQQVAEVTAGDGSRWRLHQTSALQRAPPTSSNGRLLHLGTGKPQDWAENGHTMHNSAKRTRLGTQPHRSLKNTQKQESPNCWCSPLFDPHHHCTIIAPSLHHFVHFSNSFQIILDSKNILFYSNSQAVPWSLKLCPGLGLVGIPGSWIIGRFVKAAQSEGLEWTERHMRELFLDSDRESLVDVGRYWFSLDGSVDSKIPLVTYLFHQKAKSQFMGWPMKHPVQPHPQPSPSIGGSPWLTATSQHFTHLMEAHGCLPVTVQLHQGLGQVWAWSLDWILKDVHHHTLRKSYHIMSCHITPYSCIIIYIIYTYMLHIGKDAATVPEVPHINLVYVRTGCSKKTDTVRSRWRQV